MNVSLPDLQLVLLVLPDGQLLANAEQIQWPQLRLGDHGHPGSMLSMPLQLGEWLGQTI